MNNTPKIDDFATSYSKADIAFHAIGAVLNTGCTLAAVVWLCLNWRTRLPSWYLLLLATAIAMFVGDLVTGLFHWAFDTWFDENTSLLNRMVIMVREHHVYPDRLFQYSFYHHAGPLSLVAFFLTAPVFVIAIYAFPSAVSYYAVWAGVIVSFEIVLMFEFHKFGHRRHPSGVTKRVQKMHLLLSREHHMKHHSGKHDRNYCLINGVADLTCGNLFLWRGLESIISSITGAVPQRNDREWLQRQEKVKSKLYAG